MTRNMDAARSGAGLISALHVTGPAGEHAGELMLFGRFVGAWRSTWIEPVNGRVRCFIGRVSGGDIVLLSDEEQPQLRWRFTDITPDSFTWRAETSRDDGATWHFEEQMLATRVSPA